MNSLERVAKTLNFEESDRVPVYPIVSGVSRNIINANYKEWATNADTCAEALIKVTEELELDIICTLTDLSVEASDYGADLVYPENEAAHPDYANLYISGPDEYEKIGKINPEKTPRMSEHIKLCDKLVKKKGEEVPIVAFIFGPLGILSMLRGQENLFIDIMTNPAEVKEAVANINEMLFSYCDALIETGVSAIMIDTLFASGSVMSKDMWLKFEGEYVEKLARHVHEQECMFMVHNCGNEVYFDVQIETMQPEAISFLHLPDDVTSPQELKEKYGNKTTLIGHIDPPWIGTASAKEVEEESRKQIEWYKDGGGFILATGCEYPANADLKNAEVMVKAAKKYGNYKMSKITL